MFAVRMSWGTSSHARGMVVAAAEIHALHQAASAASLTARRVHGTPSAKTPSADRRRHSAKTATEQSSNALPETSAAAVPVWASMMSAARTSMGTAFRAKERAVGAAETPAMHQAASAASLKARKVHGTPSAKTPNAGGHRRSARTAMAMSSSVPLATAVVATSV